MSDQPTITDADKNCARLILEYVASVTDPRSMIERQLQIFRDEAVSAAIEAEREVWRQMWRYQIAAREAEKQENQEP